MVDHGSGVQTWYAHLSKFSVVPGQEVRRGQVVALSGGTGRVTSPHLHYEVRLGGTPVNPYKYLAKSAISCRRSPRTATWVSRTLGCRSAAVLASCLVTMEVDDATRPALRLAVQFRSRLHSKQKSGSAPEKAGTNCRRSLGEFVAMVDPVTENLVVRLTNPTYTSINPPAQNHHVSSKSRFILYGSDRMGAMSPYHLDLKTAVARQLADTKAFRPDTLAMDLEERNCFFVDGDALQQVNLGNLKARTLAEDVSDFHMNGSGNTMVVLRGGKLERLDGDRGTVLVDNVTSRGIVSPAGTTSASLGKKDHRKRRCGECRSRAASRCNWQRARCPARSGTRIASHCCSCARRRAREVLTTLLREVSLDGRDEGTVAQTSQFISFAPNADGTVFIGASRSKAQPTVVLMLRSVRREMTLCEHHASHPEMVRPVFSPNSRRVYFASDRHGKPALYVVNVELLVEPTEGS